MNHFRSWLPACLFGLVLVLGAACDPSSDAERPRVGGDGDDIDDDTATLTDAAARAPDATIADSRDSTKIDAAKTTPRVDASEQTADKSDAAPVDASVRDAGAAGSSDASSASDPKAYAGKLDGLLFDVKCAPGTPTPLANMATCQHPGTMLRIEQKVVFGGTPGAVYDVRLRVRGIWEPTFIQGGTRPLGKLPFTVGGTVATGAGDPINYQQYFVEVSEPKQTYWLNDYQYVAHDIHKEDYEAPLRIAAGATVTVVMNDGNDREIANWTKDYFEGLEPYAKAPSTGQLLRLDVVSVSAR